MERRGFLKSLAYGLGYISGGILLGYPILRFTGYRRPHRRFVIFEKAGIKDGVTFHDGVFLINNGNEIYALSARCPHLGCTLNYRSESKIFKCPCHGSVFDRNGKWLTGPARRDMVRLPHKLLKSGRIRVTSAQEGPI